MYIVDPCNCGSLIGHSADALYQPAMQNKINSNEVVHQLPTMVVLGLVQDRIGRQTYTAAQVLVLNNRKQVLKTLTIRERMNAAC